MLPNTLRNRCFLALFNFITHYLFASLALLGLLPLVASKKRNRLATTNLMTIYSIFCSILFTGLYVWVIVSLMKDPQVNMIFSGVGRITWTILQLCSLLLVSSFYVLGLLNRGRMRDFYNNMLSRYKGFHHFYSGNHFGMTPLSCDNVDSDEEVSLVYMRIMRVFWVHGSVVLCMIGVSQRVASGGDVSLIKFLSFLLIPYFVKSLTSTFLYISGARCSFMFYKLDLKLRETREELRKLAKANKRPFEKMSRFCEISDLVDELARCYGNINETGNELMKMYSVQMGLILTFSVVIMLHGLFTQFQIIAKGLNYGLPLDLWLVGFNILFMLLTILEILLVVHINVCCHTGSVRVGKTIQTLLYFEDLDIRLQHSVRLKYLEL